MSLLIKEYTGKYKVVKIFRESGNRKTLKKDLTESEAQKIVQSYPDSENTMVVYMKQR